MAEKPPVVWHPAAEGNYSGASRGAEEIDYIVIHVTQGSWSSAINWFQNPSSNVSAHYVVRSSDGKIAQCVSDRNIAYHAGNWTYNERSIGIEHEGYIDDKSWFTEAMYRGSAQLAAFFIDAYNVPFNRTYIIGHNEVPGATHSDPGQWWWWSYYMDMIKSYM